MADNDTLSFLDAPVTDAAVVVEPTPVVEPAPEPLVADVEPAPAVVAEPQDKSVPLATFLDMRDQLKEAQKRLKGVDEQQQQPLKIPDPATDPGGYARYQAARQDFAILNTKLNFSEKLARKEYGDELTDAALAWVVDKGEGDEQFLLRIYSEADPYDAAIKQYQREQMLQEAKPDEWKQFQAWKASQAAGGQQPAATAQAVVAQPTTVAVRQPAPKTIANRTSAAATAKTAEKIGQGAAFDSVFQGR